MTVPLTTGDLEIDLSCLVANWNRLRSLAPGAEVAAMVKADAYGLGADRIAPALAAAGCREFFVADIGEGASLRAVLPEADIFVLSGALPGTDADLDAQRLVPVLNSRAQIDRWAARARRAERVLPASIHCDTGMNRAGLDGADTAALLADPTMLDGLQVRHVMSHLASADDPDNAQNRRQLDAFARLRAVLAEGRASLANSAGLALGPAYHFDHVRPGVALYGADPTPGNSLGVARVVTLHAPVVQVRRAADRDTVGYSATHRVHGDRRLATLAVGYGDGFSRAASNQGQVAFEGHRAPIVGRVSMDLVTVDVTDVPEHVPVEEGSAAELIGATITIDEVAAAADTIAYEVLTRLGRRYTRRYVG